MSEFYWINTFNMVEFGGPFPTAEAAREDAIRSMMAAQGMALSIAIVTTVETGQITKTASWVGENESSAII